MKKIIEYFNDLCILFYVLDFKTFIKLIWWSIKLKIKQYYKLKNERKDYRIA